MKVNSNLYLLYKCAEHHLGYDPQHSDPRLWNKMTSGNQASTSVSFEESNSIEVTLIQSACQVIPPSELLKFLSVTLSRDRTSAKPVSASLRVTVRFVMPEGVSMWYIGNVLNMIIHTVTSEGAAASRSSVALVAGVEVLEGSIEG